jgi:drug/metabolite transporter (DMT)-like permease
MPNTVIAIVLALVSALGFACGFVLTQFALRSMSPWQGAAFSVPTSTLLFWCLAPLVIDATAVDGRAVAVFAGVGLLFPATVTLLNFESNRWMGPNIAGAISALAPVFAVLFAAILLGEKLHATQFLALAAIVVGVTLMLWRKQGNAPAPPLWTLVLPFAAAAIRGGVQPLIKLGLEWWPSPLAAVLVGYTISSLALTLNALAHTPKVQVSLDHRGARWFAAVGVCNGLGVLSMYAALGRAPVALVSPLVASYPLVTVLLSQLWLRHEPVGGRVLVAVALTVGGIVVMIIS